MPDSPFLGMFAPGGPTGSIFDPAEMRRQRAFDMLGGLGAGLIQASAPRIGPPSNFFDVLGQGLAGANQGVQSGEDKYLKRALAGSQIATAAAKIKREQEWSKLLGGAMGDPAATAGATPAPAAPPAPSGDMAPYRTAIAGNESGGQPNGGYGAIGPVANKNGQRAYGKYQVMDFNIGPWTQEVLGKAMTPEEFIANPQAQDAVFNAKFGQYLKQYGNPQDAASVWFSGKPLAGNNSGPDVLGTTVPGYVAKFNKGLPPAQMPGAPPGLIPQGPAMAQMPTPAGLTPQGPAPAPMPQVAGPGIATGPPSPLNPMGPVAQPPVAQGDGSGNPVQQAQYTPQAAPAPAPAPGTATLRDVVQSLSPGVRQILGAMGPEKGMEYLLKQAEPVASPALDTATGQVVFVDKRQLGRDPRYQPVDAARLRMEGDRLELDKRRAAVDEANKDVRLGPNGPVINQQVVDAKKAVSAAQGTDTVGKMLLGDYEDVRKANTEIQSSALMARTGMAQTNRLANLLDQVNTGRFTSTTQDIKQMAKGLGINLEALGVKDDTAPAQAVQALTGQMALALRNPSQGAGMPGAMSDADRQFLTKMVPGLENTPEGRKLMIEYSRKMYQRQIEVSKIANDFMRSAEAKKDPNALYQKLQDYADKNPMFSEKDLPPPAATGSLPLPNKDGTPRVLRFNPTTGRLE